MRWGATDARRWTPRHLSNALVAAVGIGAVAGHALADIARLTPTLLLEQIFTDNIRGSANDRDADAVTTVGLRLNAEYETSRIQTAAIVNLYYNEYWATNEFDDFNGDGTVIGRLTILDDRLFFDGIASRQEVFIAPDATSGTGLSTGNANTRQTEYSVGPLLTLNMFDLADLAVRGTYVSVKFDDPLTGPPPIALGDITAKSVAARITTGERHTSYELIGTGEYLETDADFVRRNIIGHAILHVTSTFSAIGRYGYERISDPSFSVIRGPRWAVGGRYAFREDSFFQLEFGERFGETNWYGLANVALSPRITLNAEYTDTLVPAQLANLRLLDDLFDDSGNLDLQPAPQQVVPNLTLVDQVVRDKDLRATTTYTRDQATFALTTRHSERQIPALASTEKQFVVDLRWRELLSRSLTGTADIAYLDNYHPAVGTDMSQQYRAEVGFNYLINNELTFSGSYTWTLTDQEIADDTQINVIFFGLEQTY